MVDANKIALKMQSPLLGTHIPAPAISLSFSRQKKNVLSVLKSNFILGSKRCALSAKSLIANSVKMKNIALSVLKDMYTIKLPKLATSHKNALLKIVNNLSVRFNYLSLVQQLVLQVLLQFLFLLILLLKRNSVLNANQAF